MTQPLLAAAGAPSVSHPRFAPRPSKVHAGRNPAAAAAARSEAAIAASAADGQSAPRRLARQWLWLALAVALVVVYLIVRMLAANHGESSGDAAAPGDTAVPETHSNAVAPAPPAALPLPTATSVGTVVASPDADATAASAAALKSAAAKARARKAAAKVEAPSSAEPLPAPTAVAPPEPPRPAPKAEVARDPWQSMNEGLTRCARLDWLDRGACEQRLRLQYCTNHWGLVMQCPIGPTDHGR